MRTTYQSILRQRFRPALLLFMLGEIVVVILFCYIPTFQPYFQTANMNWYNFVFPLALGLSIIIIDEIKKLLFRKYPKSCIRNLIFKYSLYSFFKFKHFRNIVSLVNIIINFLFGSNKFSAYEFLFFFHSLLKNNLKKFLFSKSVFNLIIEK